jgi:16S rRNA (guanine527-N7)-methyltransferase
MPDRTADLRAALEEPARRGILGSDIDGAIEHARQFARAMRPARRIVDLGSGSGMPGLVLAVDDAALQVVLLDASERRTDLLRRTVGRLGLADRAEVVCRPAEAFGRDHVHRGTFDAVVARAFGPPAMVAECGAPLLRLGGQLLVSEPPAGGSDRWPAKGLADLGLRQDASPLPHLASFTLVDACSERFPRRRLRPPLF